MGAALLACILLGAVILLVATILHSIWFIPRQRRRWYEAQGIRGPTFHPIVGNNQEMKAALAKSMQSNPVPMTQLTSEITLPDSCAFSKQYGNVFVHEILWTTMLTVAEPALVREVLVTKAAYYCKAPVIRNLVMRLLGNGLVFSDGDLWKQQRKIHNPAFQKTYLKGLLHHFKDCSDGVASRWRARIAQGGGTAEVEVSMEMSTTTLDIIARSAFGATMPGSAPTSKGVLAFESITPLFVGNLKKLFTIIPLIPGYRFLPTPGNAKDWKRENYINGLLEEIVEARLKAAAEAHASGSNGFDKEHPYGHDLLGMMIQAWKSGSPTMTRKQLLSECKTIFVAGHSTTALGLTWALFLMARHPEWQERLRQEVLHVCHGQGEGGLTMDSFRHMTQMEMFMKEVYRLYPPVANVFRQCHTAHKIGDINVAPGTCLLVPIALLHQSKEQWGDDYDQFRPERWEKKFAYSKDRMAYCTFGAGPRHCLGKEFALMETFTMLATLLTHFQFAISPTYRHAPGHIQSIRPLYGLHLLLTEL